MLIHNLFDYYREKGLEGGMAISVKVGQPSDNRTVILMDHDDKGQTQVVGAKYVNGKWYSNSIGNDLTDSLSSYAIWTECLLGDRISIGEWIQNEQ